MCPLCTDPIGLSHRAGHEVLCLGLYFPEIINALPHGAGFAQISASPISLSSFLPEKQHSFCSLLLLFSQRLNKLSPTLRDTMDCSPPGSSVHGIPQGRVLDWVAISFFRDLPDQGIESVSPALAGGFFSTEPPGTPVILFFFFQLFYNLICHLYDNNIKSSSSQHIFPFSCCSVAKSCLTLCQLDCNSSGLPVHHCLLELAKTHVH